MVNRLQDNKCTVSQVSLENLYFITSNLVARKTKKVARMEMIDQLMYFTILQKALQRILVMTHRKIGKLNNVTTPQKIKSYMKKMRIKSQ